MNTNPDIVWKTISKTGTETHLKESTLNEHIFIDNNRLEFKGEEDTLKKIIEEPIFIVKDKTFPDRVLYMDTKFLKNLDGIYCISVVVDTVPTPNDVVTAIATRKIPQITAGRIIYERN